MLLVHLRNIVCMSVCLVIVLVIASGNAMVMGADLASQIKSVPNDGWITVTVSSPLTVDSDLTVPANVCLKFENGGMCDVKQGATLNIQGPVQAPPLQVFRGDGKVRLSPSAVDRIYPQWWGAKTNDKIDDTAAIQSAIDSVTSSAAWGSEPLPPGGGVVFLPAGRYEISSTLKFNNGLTIEGIPMLTELRASAPMAAMFQRPDTTPPPEGIHFNIKTRIDGMRIAHIQFNGDALADVGMDLTNSSYMELLDVRVMHCNKTGILFAELGMYNQLKDVAVAYCGVGIEFNIGSMDNNIFNARISVTKTGLLVNHTGHLNVYGATFDAFTETAVEIKGGDSVNLHYPWFDSVAGTVPVKIASTVSQCTVVNPRFSGPTPKIIDDQSKVTMISDN